MAAEFRMPHEPLPVPPVGCSDNPVPLVGSDEESFVVLSNCHMSDFEDLSFEEDQNLAGKSIVQEAKQLIKDELDTIQNNTVQQGPLQEQINGTPENVFTVQNGSDLSRSESSIKMDQSSILPAMPQPQLYPHGDFEGNDTSNTISIISFAPSEFSSEELQTKVNQLIDENVHLKDVIIQNNMSMKAQYEKIVAWQQDVEKVHEAHKEKFSQAKQCIETLKVDNVRLEANNILLQEKITNLRDALKLQETEHVKTREILTQSSENNLKEFELDIANKRVKELEEALEKEIKAKRNSVLELDILNKRVEQLHEALKSNVDSEDITNKKIKELTDALEENKTKSNMELANEIAKSRAMEEKLERYEQALEDAFKKNRELEKNTSAKDPPSYLEKIKVTEEKLVLAEMATDQANKEILSLRNQLARNLQTSEVSPKLLFELEQAKNKIGELEETLTSRNATLIDTNMRVKKIEELLSDARENVKTMEVTVVTLQEQLEEAKIEVWKHKQKLIAKESELQTIHQQLEVAPVQQQRPEPLQNPNAIDYLRQQLMQSQMATTQCDQNRAVAYAQLEKQKNEIAELRRELEAKQSDNDVTFALRTQLEVYKTDFEAEREAKEDIKRDKNKLSEDLQHLHRRNRQLQEEIELLRERLKEPGGGGQGASGWSSNKNNQSAYRCPRCQFGFHTLNAVENHVQRCIELDDSLP